MPTFEWDPEKARANLSKHGVAFEDAALVWDDPLHLARFDRLEGGEERWHTLGSAAGTVLLLVVHTYRNRDDEDVVRIISARRATRSERTRMAISREQRERLEKLAVMPPESIDTSDAPEVLDWSGAVRGRFYKPRKEAITIRLDSDVLAWFKDHAEGGRGYQSDINRVLRQHVEHVTKTRERA